MTYQVPNRKSNREPPTTRIVFALLVLCMVLIPVVGFLNIIQKRYQLHGNITNIFINSISQKPGMVAMIPLMLSVPSLIAAIVLDLKSNRIMVIRFAYAIAALLILAAIYLFLTRTPLVAV